MLVLLLLIFLQKRLSWCGCHCGNTWTRVSDSLCIHGKHGDTRRWVVKRIDNIIVGIAFVNDRSAVDAVNIDFIFIAPPAPEEKGVGKALMLHILESRSSLLYGCTRIR